MGTKQNIIEINGQKYDAASGRRIGASSPLKSGTSIDGFSPMHTGKPTTPHGNQSGNNRPARTAQKHQSKPMQKSQTLMRKSVKKPVTHAVPPSSAHVSGIQKRTLGHSNTRQQLASATAKSPLVQKYGTSIDRSTVVKIPSTHTVKRPPVPADSHRQSSVTQGAHTNSRQNLSAAARMIESSLDNATAHENEELQPIRNAKKKRFLRRIGVSSRAMALSSAVLAGVLLGGFFAVQNVPNLSMRVASARAGFDARMPGYNPSGFSFAGPINYQSGRVTVSFRSNTDDRHYDVTQRSSNWNSDALLANFILEENKQYQTYVDRGRTLYIYDGSNATWVDDGVWYTVEGQSAMTTDQLVRLAASI